MSWGSATRQKLARRALERQLEREKDRTAIIVGALEQAVSALPPLVPLPSVFRTDKKEDPHAGMLDISDVHLGEYVDPIITGGLSQYSFEVFKKRGERFRKGVLRIAEIHRKVYPVDTLYINFLGDIVTGEAIFPGQAFQIDLPLLTQIFEGAYWFANLLRDFARTFSDIQIRCVAGNHGRGGEKGKSHPRTNWDVAFYRLLQILLAEDNDPSVCFHHEPALEMNRLRESHPAFKA